MLFFSITAMLGKPHQANDVVTNGYLEGFAGQLRADGQDWQLALVPLLSRAIFCVMRR